MKTTTRIIGVSAIAVACIFAADTASATLQNQNQGQGQGQGQIQGQGQLQGQTQSIRNNQNQGQGQSQSNRNYNTNLNSNSDNFQFSQNYESRPSGPAVFGTLAGLPSFSNSGLMNACAGAEAWTFSLGGSVGLAGGQISGSGGLIGFGDSKVVTIVPCEIRESVVLLGEAGFDTAAIKVACLHPYMEIGLESEIPGICGGTPAVPDASKVANATTPPYQGETSNAVYKTGSRHPDFANLQ